LQGLRVRPGEGCALLNAMAGVRAWGIYLTVVVAVTVAQLACGLFTMQAWHVVGASDEAEVGSTLFFNAPL